MQFDSFISFIDRAIASNTRADRVVAAYDNFYATPASAVEFVKAYLGDSFSSIKFVADDGKGRAYFVLYF